MQESSCVWVSLNILNCHSNILSKILKKRFYQRWFKMLNTHTFQKKFNPFTIPSWKLLLSEDSVKFKKPDVPCNELCLYSLHFPSSNSHLCRTSAFSTIGLNPKSSTVFQLFLIVFNTSVSLVSWKHFGWLSLAKTPSDFV